MLGNQIDGQSNMTQVLVPRYHELEQDIFVLLNERVEERCHDTKWCSDNVYSASRRYGNWHVARLTIVGTPGIVPEIEVHPVYVTHRFHLAI